MTQKSKNVAMKSVWILLLSLVSATVALAQNSSFELKQARENGIYKKGEKIRVVAHFQEKTSDSLVVFVHKNNLELVFRKAFLPVADSLIIYEGSCKEPCSVMVEALVKNQKQVLGMLVTPEKLKPGTARPKDFDAFWNNEKQQLEALRMEVKTKDVEPKMEGYVCQDIEINCTGPKPARGYFAKPEQAKVRSLPIVLLVHAAGVKGEWCRSKAEAALRYAKMGNGALCFDLNAHGMLNGQPEEYYSELENGELKNYYIQGIESRDEFYFRGMYLRLLRTIEFLTRQPEWDKKRIIVIGESQGGGQALAAAGLDSRVSAVVATVPAMCDWGGTLVGRKGGWPQPFDHKGNKENVLKTVSYFDAAHLLKNSKATLVVEVGLVDQTCPSISIYAAINQAKGAKIVFPVPYREHSWPSAAQRKHWDPSVFNPKNEFVENYLK
jgi:cephalosporin-C deacetylase-like acetyl esterase